MPDGRLPVAARLGPLGAAARRAVALVRVAAPRRAGRLALLEVAGGLLLAAQLGTAHRLLSTLDDAAEAGGGRLAWPAAAFGAVSVAGALLAGLLDAERVVLAERAQQHVNGRLLAVAAAADLERFESADFHDRLQRALATASTRPYLLVRAAIGLLTASVTAGAALVALALLAPALVPLAALAVVPVLAVTFGANRSLLGLERELTRLDRERYAVADLLTTRFAAGEVRALGLGQHLRRRHDDLLDRRVRAQVSLARHLVRRETAAAVASTVLGVAVLVLAVQLTANGHLSLADLTVVAVTSQQLASRLREAAAGLGGVHEHALFLAEVDDLLEADAPGAAADTDGPLEPRPATLEVRAEAVGYRYPGTDAAALADASIVVAPGEVVALVGRNGSGKTTLVKLLCGLLPATTGTVRWNGEVVEAGAWRRRAGWVAVLFQDFLRFPFTARENIAAGDPGRGADEAAVVDAARRAGIHDTIAALADGYDTLLAKDLGGGADLSTGQWQRLALARAFFGGAPLVVLDEPTAALDAEAEHDLFERLRDLLDGRAAVIVTHRLTSLRGADRIYVLDAGRVVESGRFDALAASGGPFADLLAHQLRAADPPHRTA